MFPSLVTPHGTKRLQWYSLTRLSVWWLHMPWQGTVILIIDVVNLVTPHAMKRLQWYSLLRLSVWWHHMPWRGSSDTHYWGCQSGDTTCHDEAPVILIIDVVNLVTPHAMKRLQWYSLLRLSVWWHHMPWQGSSHTHYQCCHLVKPHAMTRLQWYSLLRLSVWWHHMPWRGASDTHYQGCQSGDTTCHDKAPVILIIEVVSLVTPHAMTRFQWYSLLRLSV